ncbi:MAG: ABC transporter ATP-binding protein [bacterium JZ-2024 1]
MIEVQHLTKYYGTRPAVRDVSFSVPRGSVTGFLGPNGAGKTTTMRILSGFLKPTAGRVIVAGHDIREETIQAKAKIGYMPESPPIYPEMTVREFLDFVSHIKKVPVKVRRERIDSVVEETGLTEVRARIVGRLSKGYRQRVGLATALIHNPDVLILDEPTAGLDPIQIVEIRNLIRRLGQERTVLLSTHILPEVTQVCRDVIIINEGQIVAKGPLAELSGLMRTNLRVRVQVKKDIQGFLEKVRALQGVADARLEDSYAVIDFGVDSDLRDAIAEIAVKGGHRLLELASAQATLEEVFLKLASEEAKAV